LALIYLRLVDKEMGIDRCQKRKKKGKGKKRRPDLEQTGRHGAQGGKLTSLETEGEEREKKEGEEKGE